MLDDTVDRTAHDQRAEIQQENSHRHRHHSREVAQPLAVGQMPEGPDLREFPHSASSLFSAATPKMPENRNSFSRRAWMEILEEQKARSFDERALKGLCKRTRLRSTHRDW
jgi:hypothetical protein